jgi:hypothetical protein
MNRLSGPSGGTDRSERKRTRFILPCSLAMRKYLALLAGAAVVAVSTFRGIAQQGPQATPSVRPVANVGGIGILLIDRATWKVISPDGNPEHVARLNTPGLVKARRLAALAIEHPEEYSKMAELDAKARAAQSAAALVALKPDYTRQATPMNILPPANAGHP